MFTSINAASTSNFCGHALGEWISTTTFVIFNVHVRSSMNWVAPGAQAAGLLLAYFYLYLTYWG